MAPAKTPEGWAMPTFKAGEVTAEELAATIQREGGCIVKNFISPEMQDTINADVRPHIDKDIAWESELGFPKQTRRAQKLVTNSRTYTENVLANRLYQDVAEKLITSKTSFFWGSEQVLEQATKPILNATIVFSINPGAKAQPLHRDDSIYHATHTEITADQWKPGRDDLLGLFVAGKKATKANGTTRFIPRSHLWDDATPPSEDDTVYAEMDKGDAFFMLGSCYHGGSANTTQNEERLMYACFMTKGFNRQEENQYLSHSLETMGSYSREIQDIVGYRTSEPFTGWVDWKDPKILFAKTDEERAKFPLGMTMEQAEEYAKMMAEEAEKLNGQVSAEAPIANDVQVAQPVAIAV